MERDAGPHEAPSAVAHQRFAARPDAPADAGACGQTHHAEPGEPPEQVPAEYALGQRGRSGTDREFDRAGRGELFGDLHAGVSTADHQHRAVGQLPRIAVRAAVQLHDLLAETGGFGRDDRRLERSGRDDYLPRLQVLAGGLDIEEPSRCGTGRSPWC